MISISNSNLGVTPSTALPVSVPKPNASPFADLLLNAQHDAKPHDVGTVMNGTPAPVPEPALQAAIAPSSTTTTADNTVNTSVPTAIENFIEWQGAQPNPFGRGTLAEMWALQGITDPLNNTALIEQAQKMLNLADQRISMSTSYVPEWHGDWKTQMAQHKSAEIQRQALIAASDAAGQVVIGGSAVQNASPLGTLSTA
jgi:hypothetical protein